MITRVIDSAWHFWRLNIGRSAWCVSWIVILPLFCLFSKQPQTKQCKNLVKMTNTVRVLPHWKSHTSERKHRSAYSPPSAYYPAACTPYIKPRKAIVLHQWTKVAKQYSLYNPDTQHPCTRAACKWSAYRQAQETWDPALQSPNRRANKDPFWDRTWTQCPCRSVWRLACGLEVSIKVYMYG